MMMYALCLCLLAKKVMKPEIVLKDFDFMRENINYDKAYNLPCNSDFSVDYNNKLKTSNFEPDTIKILEFKAFSFIKDLLLELDKRFPDNLEYFRKLQFFSTNQCLNQLHTKFSELPFVHQFLDTSLFSVVETQWVKNLPQLSGTLILAKMKYLTV